MRALPNDPRQFRDGTSQADKLVTAINGHLNCEPYTDGRVWIFPIDDYPAGCTVVGEAITRFREAGWSVHIVGRTLHLKP